MKVLITDPIHEDGIEKLKGFAEVEIATDLNHESLINKIPDFDAIIVRSATKVGEDVLDAAENLKLIVRAGVGLDNIDLDYAEELGINVENTPEAPSNAVAELAIGLMFSWARNIPKADKSLKKGKWIKSKLLGTELRGKTLGLIGTGRIGYEVAKKAKGLGMDLLGHDPQKNEEFKKIGGEYVELEYLLKKSDYITLHVPLLPPTKHMLGEEEFDLMKESAVLINTARGSVIDEDALINALEENRIAGACLDVFEEDPTDDGRLLDMPNVILTPHLGASTEEAQRSAGVLAAEKVEENLG